MSSWCLASAPKTRSPIGGLKSFSKGIRKRQLNPLPSSRVELLTSKWTGITRSALSSGMSRGFSLFAPPCALHRTPCRCLPSEYLSEGRRWRGSIFRSDVYWVPYSEVFSPRSGFSHPVPKKFRWPDASPLICQAWHPTLTVTAECSFEGLSPCGSSGMRAGRL